jgi:hypothetical protein
MNDVSLADLKKSNFRGSGAIYQTDRLTLGRSPNKLILEGKKEIVERIVYKENDEANRMANELSGRLKESLLRLVVVGAENERLNKRIARGASQNSVFQSQASYDINQLMCEVQRLNQLLVEKDKEIKIVKDAEFRKSAMQSGDILLRLNIISEENKRLQQLNHQKSIELSALTGEVVKVKEEAAKTIQNLANDPRVADMKQQIYSKDLEIRSLNEKLSQFERTQTLVFQKDQELKALQDKYAQAERSNVSIIQQKTSELLNKTTHAEDLNKRLLEFERMKANLQLHLSQKSSNLEDIARKHENLVRVS